MTVVATDVLGEGLNLQDCDKIINYDLHWNPVRLIQRFGRIDRIGSEHDVIYGFNFLPETGHRAESGLTQKLHNRIQEIHDTIGEDSAILDRTEHAERRGDVCHLREARRPAQSLRRPEEDDFLDLNEAEEILRQLRRERPGEFERIANLRDGIRTARPSSGKGTFVFCQAGRYQQLFLLDPTGGVVTRDIPRVLGAIKCGPDLQGLPLPQGYNQAVMRVKSKFAEEVKHRRAEREYTPSLTQGQRYVLRELRVLFNVAEDSDVKAQINILEPAFRGTLTRALNQELNRIRRNGIVGHALLKTLGELYYQHNMRDWISRRNLYGEDQSFPAIICSEALI